MKHKIILFFLLATHSFSAYPQHNEALEMMQQFRYKEAIKVLGNASQTTESQLLKAECHQKLYDYASAIGIYEKLFEKNPDNLSVTIAAAECASQSGDVDAAVKYWKKADLLSPGNLYFQTKKAMAFYRAGDWTKTIESANAVFKSDSVPLLLRMTGDAYLNMDDAIMANYFFTKAIDKNPSDYIALSRICEFYYALGEIGYDTVVVMTDNYLKNINENQRTIGQLNGMAKYASGENKKALARLKKNVELGDSSYTTSYFLGMSYYASRLYFDATKWLGKAYDLKKEKDINLLYYYGSALAMTYDPKKGIEILLEGVEKIETIYKMLTNFKMLLADAHLRSNTPSKAVGYYKSVSKRQPEGYSILYNIAHTYDRMADLENALSYYEQFIKSSSKQKRAKKDSAAQIGQATSTEQFYYESAAKRIQKIKEELFLKKGKR